VAIGEQFTAGFGINPQLQVQRQMVDKMRATQGGNQLLKYDYRIMISSYKTEKVKLQVWDRLPYAENYTINVMLVKTTPELSKDPTYLREQRPNNLLRWDVALDPNFRGEKAFSINFDFKLELDRQMTIGGYQTTASASPLAAPVAALAPISSGDTIKIRAAMEKLSPEDRKLAAAQVYCAIDQDSSLGVMGTIYKVMVKGQPIFLCCKGCETETKAHPYDALLQFQRLTNRVSTKR